MKSIFITVALFLSLTIGAQLPPAFSSSDNWKVEKSNLSTVYLSPRKVVWKNALGESEVMNENILLYEGIGQADLATPNHCVLKSTETDFPSIILDYGKELHGGVQIVTGRIADGKPTKVRIRFGESVSETMSDVGEKGATNDHAIRDLVLELPQWGVLEFGNTGFRFIRIDLIDPSTSIEINEIRAKFIYQDAPYLGSFKCDDPLLNEIWMTGAYTVHLNMQKYVWDGIKRDRLVWIGDINPEVATINAVFGNNDAVALSLDLARDNTPLPHWMNGHSSYTLWWIITHKDLYLKQGNLAYLQEQKDYLIPLMNRLCLLIDEKGKETLDGVRFLDWPSSQNPIAIQAGLQALMILSIDAGKELCEVLGEKGTVEKCDKALKKLKKYKPEINESKQAAALLSLAGIISLSQGQKILTKDGVNNFSTFYGYYMLEALAKAGDYETAIKYIKDYWGAMLAIGATTFWEDFDINWMENASRIDEVPQIGKKDIHAEYGDYCYKGLRHSLCHGWASGPTAWLSSHVLGIQPLEPGCKKVKISPNLGSLNFAEGTFPTPYGLIRVKHTKGQDGKIVSEIETPDEIEVVRSFQ